MSSLDQTKIVESITSSYMPDIFSNNAKEKASFFAYIVGDTDKFKESAANITYPINVNVPSETKYFISENGYPTEIKSITIIDGSTINAITFNGTSYTIKDRTTAFNNDSIDGKISGLLTKKLLENSEGGTFNILLNNSLDPSAVNQNVIGSINVVDKSGNITSIEAAKVILQNTPINSKINTSQSYDASTEEINRSLSDQQLRILSNRATEAGSSPLSIYANGNLTTNFISSQMFSREKTPRRDTSQMSVKDGTFNSRASSRQDKDLFIASDTNYTFKIGDVILSIPPTHLTITQLRSAYDIDMIGFQPMNTANPLSRIVFKINTVFSGRKGIDNDLKRLITQFKYCPLNIIHSFDLVAVLRSEGSLLESVSGSNSSTVPYVPVTMDEYTIYTIEGHPDSLGATFQFTLFNYMPYFDGDVTESFKYEKVTLDKDGNITVPNKASVQTTTHLENAIHPYNFDIEYILANADKRFFRLNDTEYESDDVGSMASLYKLTVFQNSDMALHENTEESGKIDLLCLGMSARYENKFAWMPIVGYAQALPQYIGPGTLTLSLNSKVDLNNNKILSRLFKTYHELRSKDYNQIYDDRYLIISSLTNFLDSNVISIADIAVTTLQNHPGFSDVNIIMKKSPYVSTITEDDKVAELDIYWGLQRVVRAIESNNKLREIIDQSLQDATADQYAKYGWIAKWAANSGKQDSIDSIDENFADLINAAAQTVINNGTEKEKAAIRAFRLYIISGNSESLDQLISFLESYKEFSNKKSDWLYGYGSEIFIEDGLYSSKENTRINTRLFFISLVNQPVFLNMFNIDSSVARANVLNAFYGSKLTYGITLSTQQKEELDKQFKDLKDSIRKLMNSIIPQFDFINNTLDKLKDKQNTNRVLGQLGFGLDENTQASVAGVNLTSVGTDKSSVLSALKSIEKIIITSSVYGTSANTSLDSNRGVLIAQRISDSSIAQSKKLEIKKENITSDMINAAISAALKNTIAIRPPRSAHRYYPQCQSMVKLDPMLSVTVGSFFFNNLQFTNGQHIRKMMEKFKAKVDNSISPMFNTSAWNAIFPKDSLASSWQQKSLNENDPFWLMQAISYTSSKKDMSPTHLSFASSNKDVKIKSPLINFKVSTETPKDGQSLQNGPNDRPFSGMSDWMFISKISGSDVYGSTAVDIIRKRIYEKKVYSLADSGDGNSKEAAAIYAAVHDQMFNNMGVLSGNPASPTLYRRSEISTAALTNGQMFSDEKGLTQSIDIPTDQFSYYTNYMSACKNPTMLKPKKDNAISTPTSPTSDPNTQANQITKANVDLLNELLQTALNKSFGVLSLVKKGGASLRADYISKYVGAKLLDGAASNFSSREDVAKCVNDAIISAANTFIYKNNKRSIFGMIQQYPTPYQDKTNYRFNYLTIHDGKSESFNITRNTYEPNDTVIGQTPILAQTIFDAMLLRLSSEELQFIADNQYSKKVKIRTGVKSDGTISTALIFEGGEQGAVLASSLVTLPLPDIKIGKTKSTYQYIDSLLAEIEMLSETDSPSTGIINIDSNTGLTAYYIAERLQSAMQEYSSGDLEKYFSSPENKFIVDSAAEETSQYLVSQFLNSMVPTIGLQNAFPTFKVYIIDQNLSDIRFHAMDNWYDFRLVKDLMIIKSKEDPSHLLKCRVVIDERFMTLTTTFQQIDSERNMVEAKNPSADLSVVNTQFDHNFYQGKVPLRTGMRICVKLGYHTDPRLLDTVFIGTITGLQGSMDKYIFDLEASGDGRELSEPATLSAQKISGLNYGEVITKLLRSNPSVYHLGRNYGTTLEQYTRDHYLLYGFARLCYNNTTKTWKDIINLILNGGDDNSPVSMRYIVASSSIATTLTGVAAANPMTTIGIIISSIIAFNTIKNMSSSGLNDKILFEARERVNKKLTSNSSNGNIFNISSVLGGNRFDMAKAGGQIFKHFYEIYRYGHNPIDQNIWAVDIWADKITNIGSTVKINVSNTMSLWDVLNDIKRIYPNYALDIKPYGGRSTLYFGPRDWLIMRTDDPVLAMASQLEQTSSKQLMEQSGEYFKKLYEYDQFMERGNNSFPLLTEFQRTHLASSDSNIVFNGIESTPNRGWNSVVVNVGTNSYDAVANAELHPSVIRTNVKTINWTNDGNIAQQYALGFLRDGVEKMYGGTLVLRGNPKIEPYDKVYIMDAINKMYGWIEVETVIHKFDHNFGYTTHITPNLVCSVNSDAYKSTSQILLSMFTGEDMLKYGLGLAVGAVIGEVIAAGVATLSAPLVALAGVVSLGMFLFAAKNSITSAWNGISELIDKNIGRKDEQEILAMLHDLHSERMALEGMKSGLDYGFALNYLVKLYKVDSKGVKVKQMNSAFWKSLRNAYQNTYRARAGWSLLGKFSNLPGREASFNVQAMEKLNEKLKAFDDENIEKKSRGIDPDEFEKLWENNNLEDQIKIKESLWENIQSLKADAYRAGLSTEKMDELAKPFEEALSKIEENIAGMQKPSEVKGSIEFKTPNKKIIVDSKTGIKSASIKFGKGFFKVAFIQLILDAIESIPKYMETFMLSYMTKANCISISPLWHKNTLMLAGLDGWQKTNVYMHAKNMVINAKKAIENVDLAINYATPTLNNKENSLADSTQEASDKLKKSAKNNKKSSGSNVRNAKAVYDKYYNTVDKLVQKYRNKLKADCAKAILTTDKVMAMINTESNWNASNDNGYGAGLGQVVASQWLSTIQATAKKMGIQSPNNVEQARSLLKTNNELNLEVSMQILTAAINSETDIAGGNCGSITTPIGNLGLFDRALAAYNGGTGWRKGISDTNVTGKTSNAEHYRNYISKVNGALPYYTQIIKDPNSVTTVNISGVTDSTNKYSAAIVQSVTNLLNTTYKFGGKDPYTGYIDCSGLVTATYKSALGVSLQGNADMIYNSNQLTSVPATNIPVGSLLFWSGTQGNKPGATHVGIYIGNGKYIHASSASGKVIEADFSSAYARKNFLGAKTLIGAYTNGVSGSY